MTISKVGRGKLREIGVGVSSRSSSEPDVGADLEDMSGDTSQLEKGTRNGEERG